MHLTDLLFLIAALAVLALGIAWLSGAALRPNRARHHDHLIPGTPRSYRAA